jgi:hypothetical protein
VFLPIGEMQSGPEMRATRARTAAAAAAAAAAIVNPIQLPNSGSDL